MEQKKVVTAEEAGKSLDNFFNACGIQTTFLKAVETPQLAKYYFSGGFYSDSKLKKAMEFARNSKGYEYEKNRNGGFIVWRAWDERSFVGLGDCQKVLRKMAENPNTKKQVPLCFGEGEDFITTTFEECAHILIAGTTGSGKSVLLNSLIMTVALYSTAQLALIDPKGGVEMGIYKNDIHNRFERICEDTQTSLACLDWAVEVMERRYSIMAKKAIKTYDGNRLVIVIDELADLMITSGHAVETAITRIAQKGRAAGVHLIVATQDPRVSVVTGLIKYNLPTKICLTTANARHSMNVIDCGDGAKLLGKGDALIKLPTSPDLIRCQCPSITQANIMKCLTH